MRLQPSDRHRRPKSNPNLRQTEHRALDAATTWPCATRPRPTPRAAPFTLTTIGFNDVAPIVKSFSCTLSNSLLASSCRLRPDPCPRRRRFQLRIIKIRSAHRIRSARFSLPRQSSRHICERSRAFRFSGRFRSNVQNPGIMLQKRQVHVSLMRLHYNLALSDPAAEIANLRKANSAGKCSYVLEQATSKASSRTSRGSFGSIIAHRSALAPPHTSHPASDRNRPASARSSLPVPPALACPADFSFSSSGP